LKKSFKAKLLGANSGGVFVKFPWDIEKLYGKKNLVKVRASFDGVPYRGSLAKMGGSHAVLIVLKSIREKIGKRAGDTIRVTVEEDMVPRVVAIPKELKAMLAKSKKAAEFYKSLSFTHRKEYAAWVGGAKQSETRLARAKKALATLNAGKRES
jgi:hypothetical protein